jgi:hypothetical protein
MCNLCKANADRTCQCLLKIPELLSDMAAQSELSSVLSHLAAGTMHWQPNAMQLARCVSMSHCFNLRSCSCLYLFAVPV